MKRITFFPFLLLSISTLFAQETDSFTDIRDGQNYNVVKIGQQWWMQENLDIGTRINGSADATDNGVIEKYCYDDNSDNCDTYGGLYQWDELMDYNSSDNGNPVMTQGVCPVGWHLPNYDEWTELGDFLGGESVAGGKLKETGIIHWISPNIGASNESGFTALPGGARDINDSFIFSGSHGFWWSSTDSTVNYAWYHLMSNAYEDIHRFYNDKKYGFSVRCLRDFDQFGYLTISDKNLATISKMEFLDDRTIDTIVIINSSVVNTINVSSIHTNTSVYDVNKSSTVLLPGDSIHLNVAFHPQAGGIHYLDTLRIESNDPYNPLISIPLDGCMRTDAIIDIRDGQVYGVVKIGSQWWMQENLNIGIQINGNQDATDNGIIEKYCFDNNPDNCLTYGGMYQWNEMMDYESSDNENPGITRGICPVGWHLPSDDEWTELIDFLGGESVAGGKLKETGTLHWSSWNAGATNESGFTALPGGYRLDSGPFLNLGDYGYLWSSTEYNSGMGRRRLLSYDYANISNSYLTKEFAVSVRCSRDSSQFSYLTVSDKSLTTISKLEYNDERTIDTIVLINSSALNTVNVVSIQSKTSIYNLNKSSVVLLPGDSIHVNVTFIPSEKGVQYLDTLRIESDDPYHPLISVQLNGYLKPDSIIDIRNSQVYKVVKIGQQWWMQENLNIGTQIAGSQEATDNGVIDKYCYENNPDNCETYGGLYQWNEMMDYNPSDEGNPGIIQGVCPVGWRIPTNDEWNELSDFLGGQSIAGGKLKETGTIHWNSPNSGANNISGFTALPAGDRNFSGGGFYEMGDITNFWSSAEYGSNDAWNWGMSSSSTAMFSNNGSSKGYGYSVRCLRDSNKFSYLIVTDSSLIPITDLNFYNDGNSKKLILVNSSGGLTVDASSIYTKHSAFSVNLSSSTLSPGDSIHINITFNPELKNIYLDTLFIESNDPFNPLLIIPLNGTFPPEISFTDSINISCFGYSNGSATVSPSMGTPPYQYQWDDPGNNTDSIVTGLMANIYYHVTVTDTFGWSITDSIQLSQPGQLKINPHYSDTICLNSSIGYIGTDPSGGIPPYDYAWSNGASSQTITDLEAGDYGVKVTDSYGCIDSASLTIHSAVPFGEEKICIVTIDILTGHNMVIWEKTPDRGIQSYNVYREDEFIGKVPYENLSIFKDTIADPESRPFLYSISVVDTCGNESDQSPYHKPLFLQYVSSIDGVNLRWSKYEMENGNLTFDNYEIWRGGDSINLTPFAENIPTAVDIYTDNDPTALEKKYYYRIAGILEIPCEPSGGKKAGTGPYRHSLSNMDNNKFKTGIDRLLLTEGLSIYPNPFSESTTITFPNHSQEAYKMVLRDLSGKIFRTVDGITTSEHVMEKGDLMEGLYFIELRGPKIYRGKIVIE